MFVNAGSYVEQPDTLVWAMLSGRNLNNSTNSTSIFERTKGAFFILYYYVIVIIYYI